MTINTVFRASVTLMLTLCLLVPLAATGQQSRPIVVNKNVAEKQLSSKQLSVAQQQALELLRRVATDLKGESDKYGAALITAQVADVLWKFDDLSAKALFRQAFETARQPPVDATLSDADSVTNRNIQVRHQASAIKEILRRYGMHDTKGAESWLNQLGEEKTTRAGDTSSSPQLNTEVLGEMALAQVQSNPQQALRLGTLSLSGRGIPSALGRLLFALSSKDRNLGNTLYREAVFALQRNAYPYSPSLLALSNYLFNLQGRAYADALPADKNLLIKYFLDAAGAQVTLWRETRRSGELFLTESTAKYYSLLTTRAMPIVAQNAPDQLPHLQELLTELTAGLSQEQRQQTEMLTTSLEQQSALQSGEQADIDSRIRKAEKERDTQTRNTLLREIALDLMRSDSDKALTVAREIDDQSVRAQTEDDIYLILLQYGFSAPLDEAHLAVLKFNDVNLRAKLLAELANRAFRSKDLGGATELLNEAYAVASKGDDTPSKVKILLLIAKQFETYDLGRGFEILLAAIKATNQLKAVDPAPQTSAKRPLIMSITYTVINGKEITTSERLSPEDLDFNEVDPFSTRDYIQTAQSGEQIQNKLLRAKYMLAVAKSVLKSDAKRTRGSSADLVQR